jgi:2-polyprenyl-3-methyl-5-hydroxy-6-metoxy-1,4-benzoquinol methylase
LGCGAGRHLLALHKAGFHQLSGLDLSRELLEVASFCIVTCDISPM